MSGPPAPAPPPAPDATTQSRRERLLPLAWLALAFAAVAPIFRAPEQLASGYDWRYIETAIEAARRSVMWFHQVPLWNPWMCGGQVQLANPQSMVATPTFLLVLLFGTALGLKLTLVAYYFCALDGQFRLGRDLGIGVAGSALAAVLLGTGGWMALHYASGHGTFLGAALFPYAMLCYRRAAGAAAIERGAAAATRWEWALPLGAVAAWIVGDGGTSTPAMCMVILATLATIDAARARSLRPLLPLLAAAAVALLVGAARMLPVLEFAHDHPRHVFETDANPLLDQLRYGYLWKGIEPVPGKRYWFHELGWRLPWVTVPLWLWALTTVRRSWPLWILVAVGAGIVAGSAWPHGPWWLMKQLPLFRDLRVPSRYEIVFAIAVPLLCGYALDDWQRRLRRRLPARGRVAATLLALLVLLLALGDGLRFDLERWGKIFDMTARSAGREATFYQVIGDWRSMMATVLANHGAIGCDEEAPLERALRLDEGDVPQARVEREVAAAPGRVDVAGAAPGTVTAVRWTPNRVEVDVALDGAAVVSANENWNEHWQVAVDGAAAEVVRVGPKWPRDRDGGRLGARVVAAGRHTVAFVYRPRSFVVGVVVSALAWPLAIAAWLWARRRRRPERSSADGGKSAPLPPGEPR